MRKREFLKVGAAAAATLAATKAQAQGGPTYNWKMATGWPGGRSASGSGRWRRRGASSSAGSRPAWPTPRRYGAPWPAYGRAWQPGRS